jgi:acyl carrier protein phosphodiesterase
VNFLAHLYLSAPDKALMIGGFLGDFVKGPLKGELPKPIEQGIRLHRHIDSYTDQHPSQKAIKLRLPARFTRFSGIITDMMCDHFLTKHWHDFHEDSLSTFNQNCIVALTACNIGYNEKAQIVLDRMTHGNWLLNYGEIDYVSGALSRIGQRIRYENPLNDCGSLLPTICNQIEADCLEILNDAHDAVTKWRAENLMEISL